MVRESMGPLERRQAVTRSTPLDPPEPRVWPRDGQVEPPDVYDWMRVRDRSGNAWRYTSATGMWTRTLRRSRKATVRTFAALLDQRGPLTEITDDPVKMLGGNAEWTREALARLRAHMAAGLYFHPYQGWQRDALLVAARAEIPDDETP